MKKPAVISPQAVNMIQQAEIQIQKQTGANVILVAYQAEE